MHTDIIKKINIYNNKREDAYVCVCVCVCVCVWYDSAQHRCGCLTSGDGRWRGSGVENQGNGSLKTCPSNMKRPVLVTD